MSETEKDLQAQVSQQEDHTPPPEDPSQVLSPRRRSALVTYLAILFAVAFLFVAITMAMEAKRLKISNEALEDDSKKTSASLNNSINALQEENQRLQLVNQDQQSEIEELKIRFAEMESAASEASAQQETLEAEIASLGEAMASLEEEKAGLETRVEELTKQAQDAVTASELLQKAIALNEEGKMTELSKILLQIAPLRDSLSPTEQEIYESLQID
jgi:chromosome segregation ATPase